MNLLFLTSLAPSLFPFSPILAAGTPSLRTSTLLLLEANVDLDKESESLLVFLIHGCMLEPGELQSIPGPIKLEYLWGMGVTG